MPITLRIGKYVIFFWLNENEPLEPIHVHIAEGNPHPNATKLWISSSGKVIVSNNNSRIPDKTLRRIIRAIEANSTDIIASWLERFGEIRYFC